MDELVSRNYVLAEYDKQHYGPPGGARKIMEQAPAVDAAPVVHGRWVKVSGYATPGGDPVWKCSECGKGVHVYGIEHGTYGAEIADGQWVSCPNCGARMDSEGE